MGRATALSSLLLEGDKRYIAEIKLGTVTDTDDITGTVLKEAKVNITSEQLKAVLNGFLGVIDQVPPAYSAIKKDGVRLYKLAREGKNTEISSRKVEIFEANLIEDLSGENIFKVEFFVSKGTYIRSLARDLGEALGCGAALYSLRRIKTSQFCIEDCVPLDDLTEDNIGQYLLSEETVVSHLRAVNITQKQATRFCNGGQLSFERLNIPTDDFFDGELFRIKHNGVFLGVGFADIKRQQVAVKCVIRNYEL